MSKKPEVVTKTFKPLPDEPPAAEVDDALVEKLAALKGMNPDLAELAVKLATKYVPDDIYMVQHFLGVPGETAAQVIEILKEAHG